MRPPPSKKDQIIGGIAFFALLIGVAIFFLPIIGPGKESMMGSACLSNQKQLALAFTLYAEENDGTLPFRDGWYDGLRPYNRNFDGELRPTYDFKCPKLSDEPDAIGYSFNSNLDRARLAAITEPDKTILTFESINLARNASDPLVSLPQEPRHPRGNTAAYLDGHARTLKKGQKP